MKSYTAARESVRSAPNAGRQREQRRGRAAAPLDQHAQHAERVAAQCERILVAGRQQADAEDADQRFELVGQRDTGRRRSRGNASPAKRGR